MQRTHARRRPDCGSRGALSRDQLRVDRTVGRAQSPYWMASARGGRGLVRVAGPTGRPGYNGVDCPLPCASPRVGVSVQVQPYARCKDPATRGFEVVIACTNDIRRDTRGSLRISASGGAHPPRQVHVVDLVEHDAHRLADLDRGRVDRVDVGVGARYEVAREADQRILFELDDDRVVRREVRERGQQRRMRDDERPDATASRGRFPSHVDRTATRAHRTRRHAPKSARRARLHEQLTARTPGPELGRRRLLDVRKDPGSFHYRSPVKRMAEVGTPSPLVTSETFAPSTCDVLVPRIWRTPSRMRLNPCTYASDMPPPDVFVGRRPFGHSSAPSSVNGPPSPRSQKP